MDLTDGIDELLDAGMRVRDIADALASRHRLARRTVYEAVLERNRVRSGRWFEYWLIRCPFAQTTAKSSSRWVVVIAGLQSLWSYRTRMNALRGQCRSGS